MASRVSVWAGHNRRLALHGTAWHGMAGPVAAQAQRSAARSRGGGRRANRRTGRVKARGANMQACQSCPPARQPTSPPAHQPASLPAYQHTSIPTRPAIALDALDSDLHRQPASPPARVAVTMSINMTEAAPSTLARRLHHPAHEQPPCRLYLKAPSLLHTSSTTPGLPPGRAPTSSSRTPTTTTTPSPTPPRPLHPPKCPPSRCARPWPACQKAPCPPTT